MRLERLTIHTRLRRAAERLLRSPAAGRASALLARFGAPAISVIILFAALLELHAMDWTRVLALVPRAPLFWLVFAAFYLAQPVADWAIYRRIWGVGPSGIIAMMRKTIGNELLLGYVGEMYLFTWARRAGHDGRSAIRSVKDVSILSAAAGGVATLTAAAAAAPFLAGVPLSIPIWALAAALVLVATPPVLALGLRRRLFFLAPPLLRRIAAIHVVRAFAGVALTALLWRLALPEVAASWLLVLSAFKLLVSRLPLISNRELVFAGVTALLLGHRGEVAALMAMMATLTVATHVLVGVATSGADIAAELTRRRPRLAEA